MSQTTLDDEDLFGEAAEEVRADVATHLDAAVAELPEPDAIWSVESDNTLGVLNALRSGLDVGEARAHLRDAKKWYALGERAEVFEDGADLVERIESVEELIADVETAFETVGKLTSSIPTIRSRLEGLHDDEEE